VEGLKPDDQQITVDSITYDPTSFLATLYINHGVALPGGTYRLFICGTTSITDPTQTVFLNNHTSDSILNFVISQGAATTNAKNNNSKLPNTGFVPGLVTNLPLQPAAKVYSTYGSLLLEIPALGVNTAIIGIPATSDGWDVTWLGSQAGWLNGTAFPTWSGNSVITGHVWDANNQPGIFVNLRQLKYGDQVKIHAWGQVYTFEVRSNGSVLPGSLASVLTHEDKSWITLLTCENYNPFSTQYTRRRIARAVLTSVTAEK
ncbi:MAG: class F sortase, partial [Chloroflexi bacterium]|nr:class F sortase [Chloroflexota bacterium]